MRKNITTLFLLIVFYVSAHAQQGYLSFGGAYGVQVFGNQVEGYHNVENDNQAAQISQPMFSQGKGFYFGASMGMFFSNNMGFDLGLQYHISGKQVFYQNTIINHVLYELEKRLSGRRFLINPSFVLRTEPALLTPYIKIGPSIGIITQETEYFSIISEKELKQRWKYTGPISMGIQSALGVSWKFSDNLELCFETQLLVMHYKPTQRDMMSSLYNGRSNLESLLYYEKHVVFTQWAEDEFSQGAQNTDEPVILNAPSFSYTSLNFYLGMRYLF